MTTHNFSEWESTLRSFANKSQGDCGCAFHTEICLEEIDRLRADLKWIAEMCEQLPSGIDAEADPANESPEDATAFVGGLIWQRAVKAAGGE